jgi:hypothetical protein
MATRIAHFDECLTSQLPIFQTLFSYIKYNYLLFHKLIKFHV